jgi:hypothetical protein
LGEDLLHQLLSLLLHVTEGRRDEHADLTTLDNGLVRFDSIRHGRSLSAAASCNGAPQDGEALPRLNAPAAPNNSDWQANFTRWSRLVSLVTAENHGLKARSVLPAKLAQV